jgi:hypothetical protein
MSAEHLHAYFDQPLEFSRYLEAERLLSSQQDTTPEERASLLRIIIKGMVKGPDYMLITPEERTGGNKSRRTLVRRFPNPNPEGRIDGLTMHPVLSHDC